MSGVSGGGRRPGGEQTWPLDVLGAEEPDTREGRVRLRDDEATPLLPPVPLPPPVATPFEQPAFARGPLARGPLARSAFERSLSEPSAFGPSPSEPTPSVLPPPSGAREPLPRGASLGRYLLLERLAVGGMGEVYAAFDPQLNRKVALKLLLPSPALGTPAQARLRLLREAQAMAQLTHPNVLPVYDVGEAGERVFIAMELVEGSTLGRWLKEAPRPWREVLRVFAEAGRGLAAAHAAGLVHRDFKPDNVLVSRSGRVSVLDFGLACADGTALTPSPLPAPLPAPTAGPSAAAAGEPDLTPLPDGEPSPSHSPSASNLLGLQLTQAGRAMGTPGYMPPEQCLGQAPDGRADQFSFCVSLYTGLYGEPPFPGSTGVARTRSMLAGKLRPAPKATAVPGWVREVVLRGLSVEREARYPTMEALLAALARDPGVRRRRLLAAAAAALVVAGGGGALAFSWQRHARQCEGAAEQLAGVWDAGLAERVRAAFLATGVPYAGDSFSRVAAALDAHAAAWAAGQQQACEATRVRGEASERMLGLRTGCLERKRGELQAMVDVLARADAHVVERSTHAVAGLSRVEDCADVDALTRHAEPPGPDARAEVEAVRGDLARAAALVFASKPKEALALVAPAVERAGRLGYAPLEAEALQRLGHVQAVLGEDAAAEESLKRALWSADAARHDEVRPLAARWLAELSHARGGKAAAAATHAWLDLGTAALRRMGRPPEAGVPLDALRGLVLLSEERAEEAEAVLRRAAAAPATTPAELLEAGYARLWLSDAVAARARLDEAVRLKLEAMGYFERVSGPEHPRMALALSNLSADLIDSWRYPEGLTAARRAIAIQEGGKRHDALLLSGTYNNLGFILGYLGRHAEAEAALRRSLALLAKSPDALPQDVGLTSSNLGAVLMGARRFGEAAPVVEGAVAGLEKAGGEDHYPLRVALMRLGRLRVLQGRPAAAVAPLERAIALYAAVDGKGRYRAETRLWLARALRESGRDVPRAAALEREVRGEYLARGGPSALAEAEGMLAEPLAAADRPDAAHGDARADAHRGGP
jgi:serine/threonine protein kinase/Tfp pilus assembly protein PilF